ncbi:MAG: methyltransferase domain-containing protein [Halanaerobium sp. MSAO_Bac5]|nr:MAG: methyltransferase domain-containing protein [Halanaerobium sp. MSAO_Bac5]
MKKDFMNAVEFSHHLIKKHLNKDSTLIDATAGNGKDTLFLAELADQNTEILAFDIQKKAVENTKELLEKNKLGDKVKVINDSHANLDAYLKEDQLSLVLFNLGYLPGGDKSIITKAESTLKAVEKSLYFLKKYGIIILVIYKGHQGALKEQKTLIDFVKKLDYKKYNVLKYEFINQSTEPPEVIAIIRRA